jgi:multidrug efflux system membrane fusion protein
VQRGPTGTFVYVIDGESKVAVRPITVAMQDDARAVISDGVKTQEQVVTTGFTRLSNGTRVRVQAGEGEPQPDAAPSATPSTTPQTSEAAPPERRRKREGGAGAENTDGKQWPKRSESAPATPSTKQ